MTDKIMNQGRAGLDITQTRAKALGSTQRSGASETAVHSEAPKDDFKLTDTATNLKRIEARLAQMPETDQDRIDDIKQRLESGSYEVNHERLAEKMLRLDQELF